MIGLRGLLRVAVVGFAVIVGGKALYQERDRLMTGWRDLVDGEKLKDLTEDLSVAKLLGLVGSLREYAGQFARLK